jgi:hypothetical protein
MKVLIDHRNLYKVLSLSLLLCEKFKIMNVRKRLKNQQIFIIEKGNLNQSPTAKNHFLKKI